MTLVNSFCSLCHTVNMCCNSTFTGFFLMCSVF